MKHDQTPPVSPDPDDRPDPGASASPEPTPLPPRPDSVAAIFPADRLALIEAYAEILANDGVVRGLIGPREAPRLWERHLVNCGLLATVLPADATVADIGSGAGLPGLVLAIARPDLQVTLIEPLLRRTTFLEEVVEQLGLDNVVVRRGKADAFHGELTFDVVTSRAVSALGTLAEWSMPLVAPHGQMVAMKGSSAQDEVAAAADVLRELGCGPATVEVVRVEGVVPNALAAAADAATEEIRVVRLSWADPSRVSLRVRRSTSKAAGSTSSTRSSEKAATGSGKRSGKGSAKRSGKRSGSASGTSTRSTNRSRQGTRRSSS